MTPDKLLDKIQKTHDAALRSLDRYLRCTGGTNTSKKAFDSYVKHCEGFDAAARNLREILTLQSK